MAKFDAVERYMIDQGLAMMEAGFRKEIQDAKSNGKTHLFSENYVDMQMKNIRAKITEFTSARAKKSINKNQEI
tara:strand:+ start:3679 stop:3900 length:222 start_codon:yes stop_codon:yes gene_type:complete